MTNTGPNLRAGRQLILIDIENLTGTPSPTCDKVEAAKADLRKGVPGFDDAQHIVACSHHAAPVVAFAFQNARHLWRSGPDGADLALLGVLENERVADRFERVTICSGDGIFTMSAAWLAGAGVVVTVVSEAEHLSNRLRLAAKHVVLLPVAEAVSAGSAS